MNSVKHETVNSEYVFSGPKFEPSNSEA